MAFLTTTSILTDQFIGALCNTLVHSLWQGVLLAAVTGFLIILTRKASAALRYNLLIAALVIFAVGVGATFIIQFNRANVVTSNTSASVSQVNSFTPVVINNFNTPIATVTFSDRLYNYLNSNHNTIVLIWFLIICAKSIQLAVGLWGVRRLKTRQVSAVSTFWDDRIRQLANNLQIKQAISLLESGLAKVPMVIGHLKPVILMPIGLLTALTNAQVEAILVHELAHIKRRDYLVNLLQSLMEIVFFFNPAVLWVSQLIKTERENCCDDLAMVQSSSKLNYIRAMVSCNEYQLAVPAYAVAFPGGKSSLLDRVKRLASNSNHSLNLFEKTALAICFVASGLFLSAFSEKEKIRGMADKVVAVIHNIQTKSEYENLKETVTIKKENKAVKKKVASDHSDIFHPNDKDSITTVAVSNTINNLSFNTGTHLNLGSACLPPLAVQLAALNAKTDVKLNSTMSLKRSVKINNGTADSSLKTYNYKYNASNNTWYDYKPNNNKVDNKKHPDTTKRIKVNATPTPMPSPMKINHQTINVSTNVQTKVDTTIKTKVDAAVNPNVVYDLDGPSSMKYANNDGKNTKYIAKKIDISGHRRITFSSNVYQTDSTKNLSSGPKLSPLNLKLHIPQMADALYNAGLIKDKTYYTAQITNDALIVNGVKQSEENHQRILKLYQKKPDDKVNLSFTYPGK